MKNYKVLIVRKRKVIASASFETEKEARYYFQKLELYNAKMKVVLAYERKEIVQTIAEKKTMLCTRKELY